MADYLNNKKLYQTLLDFANEREQNPDKDIEIPRYVCECFILIAERVGRRVNFRRYSYLDEMKSDGIEDCVKYVCKFDPHKYNNPFGYFTKIIWQAFLRRIDKEKKQTAIKGALMRNVDVSSFDVQEHDFGEDWTSSHQAFLDQYSSFDIPYPTRKKTKPKDKIEDSLNVLFGEGVDE